MCIIITQHRKSLKKHRAPLSQMLQLLKGTKTLQPALIFLSNQTFPFLYQILYLIIITISVRKSFSSEMCLCDLNIGKAPKAANFAGEVQGFSILFLG